MQGDDLGRNRVFRSSTDDPGRELRRSVDERRVTDGIAVYLVVSRFQTDHALTYLFCDAAPAARVKAFVDARPDRFRGDNVVIELGERYSSLEQARQRALGLRTWLSNVNIVFPPLRIT